jgi:hypothetical protein
MQSEKGSKPSQDYTDLQKKLVFDGLVAKLSHEAIAKIVAEHPEGRPHFTANSIRTIVQCYGGSRRQFLAVHGMTDPAKQDEILSHYRRGGKRGSCTGK